MSEVRLTKFMKFRKYFIFETMKITTKNIEDDRVQLKDETEHIMANAYLGKKLNQGRKDMEYGKGVKIFISEI